MEIDKEELKKHAHRPQMHMDQASTPNMTIEGTAPEVKKLLNDETPPLHVKAKALFLAQKVAEKEDTIMMEASEQKKKHHMTQPAATTGGQLNDTSQADNSAEMASLAPMQQEDGDMRRDNKPDKMVQVTATTAMNKPEMVMTDMLADNTATSTQTQGETMKVTPQVADEMSKALTVISPKEWWYLHNHWLQSIMQVAMGNKAHPNIPNLMNTYTPHRMIWTTKSKSNHLGSM